MGEIEEEEDYKDKLRNNGSPNASKKEQDMVNLEGDIHYKYADGEVVWAKYLDYPWWPGQVEINNKPQSRRRKNSKKSTITVKWFGDFGAKTNECKLINVVSWDPDDANSIYVEVDD